MARFRMVYILQPILTFVIVSLGVKVGATTLGIMTFGIMTLNIKGLLYDCQHKWHST
jgi:hypothetical protein